MLKQQIQDDLKKAMFAKDENKLSTIRMLKSAIQYYEIQKGGAGYEATDEDVIDVIGKEVKKRKESTELYEKGGRMESAEKEREEAKILESYLPQQLSENEIAQLVDDAISQTGATSIQDMGKVMGILMPSTKGKADSTLVSNLVRQKLVS